MKQKIDFLRINRNSVIATIEMDYIPRLEEAIVLNNKGYIVRAIHHYPEIHAVKILLDDFPYIFEAKL